MKSESPFVEFRPAIRFVVVFVVLYLAGNSLYGVWIEQARPYPDAITRSVSRQVSYLISFWQSDVTVLDSRDEPVVLMGNAGGAVIRVFEGCNGINVMVVFVAFLVAIGGKGRHLLLFGAFGLLVVHVANLLRVGLLYWTAIYQPHWFYYIHKYLFTAGLYAVVFLLWYLWIRFFMQKPGHATTQK